MAADARAGLSWAALLPTSLLAGCAGPQSVHDPAGPTAQSIGRLGVTMYVVATLVVVLVTVLALIPVLRRRERQVNERLFLWGGGVALPAITLSFIVPYVMSVGHETRAATRPDRLSVDVTGWTYWWEVSYRRGGKPVRRHLRE